MRSSSRNKNGYIILECLFFIF
uniref:Uncharacterized protein n=1 Tax=Rhizophora mucronata TaxID=61149 RepID=A0A2P2PXF1_RHIMU